MRTIEIVIRPDGQAQVETRGFTGPECRQASQFLEQALGRRTGERLTGEFYQQQSHQQTTQEPG